MARPKNPNRDLVKTFRMTVKIPAALETKVKAAAAANFDGNFSALVRIAVEQYMATQPQPTGDPK